MDFIFDIRFNLCLLSSSDLWFPLCFVIQLIVGAESRTKKEFRLLNFLETEGYLLIQIQYDHDNHLVEWSFPGKHKRVLWWLHPAI